MAVRNSLSAVIAKVRDLIADTESSQTFSDQQIQDALDERRFDVYLMELQYAEIIASTGVYQYTSYFATVGWWETDVTLQNGSFATLTPTTSDSIVGKWTFAVSTNPPVFLTGKNYDIYAAAADLLEMWDATLKLEFDFLAAGRSFKRSNKSEQIERLIALYRKRQRIGYSEMIRRDMN